MQTGHLWAALAVCGSLAACGENLGEQALYGAGAGAVGSAIIDGNVFTGAALGAAANTLYCQNDPAKCN